MHEPVLRRKRQPAGPAWPQLRVPYVDLATDFCFAMVSQMTADGA